MSRDRSDSRAASRLWLAVVCLVVPGVAALALVATPGRARAQGPQLAAPATLDTTIEAGEPDYEKPNRRLVKWNEYDGPISTLRLGWGFLFDVATYDQNPASKQQISFIEVHFVS